MVLCTADQLLHYLSVMLHPVLWVMQDAVHHPCAFGRQDVTTTGEVPTDSPANDPEYLLGVKPCCQALPHSQHLQPSKLEPRMYMLSKRGQR